jgi:cytochrome c-type biogenesis protein CcmH
MMGRTQRALQRYDQAVEAYGRALALEANDDVALERAEVLAQRNKGSFAGEPWQIIRQVLAKDGKHLGGLLLAGSASYSDGKYRDALGYWQQARDQLEPNSEEAQGVETALGKAREKLAAGGAGTVPGAGTKVAGGETKATSDGKGEARTDAQAKASVSGRVTLAQALQAKVAAGDTLFIYATPADGGRMPLAIMRSTVSRLPLDFELDDSSAMNPQRKISAAGEVIVKARVSKTGNAMSQPGDLIGTLGPMKVGSRGLKLVISEEVR